MAEEKKNQNGKDNGDSLEQEQKQKNPNTDEDPQREQDKSKNRPAEKNPDDFEK